MIRPSPAHRRRRIMVGMMRRSNGDASAGRFDVFGEGADDGDSPDGQANALGVPGVNDRSGSPATTVTEDDGEAEPTTLVVERPEPAAVRSVPAVPERRPERADKDGRDFPVGPLSPLDGAAFLLPNWDPGDPSRPEVVLRDARDGSKIRYRFAAPQAVIGTAAGVHMPVRGEGLAARHAVLQALRGGVLCLAGEPGGLSSKERRTDALLLVPGKQVRLGPYELTLRSGCAAPPGSGRPRLRLLYPRTETPPEMNSPRFCLLPTDGRRAGAALTPLRPVATVGRRRGADLVLAAPAADALHALLLYGTDGPWVVDLRSAGGTRVNNAPVRRRRLALGDVVAFGGEEFRLLPEELDPRRIPPARAPRTASTSP
ncbi:FHA domain-containing protein [Alienimonas sp. DA493]|uniref:FHA domain-containing protein n=1 Tax=Alienimonas sp. DA493 TaxID=3373605 RepID=UPI00375403E2